MVAYTPRPKERFNAFAKRRQNYKARGCPCKARRVTAALVEAIDSNDLVRIFYRHMWRFEKVKK